MRPVNFRTLDLNLLKVFDAVMQERHVTRAAERLAITQPAASNALRRLRDSTQQALEPRSFDVQRDARTFSIAMADATAALFVPALAAGLK